MSDKFTLDVRQAAELTHAFERTGWTNADIKKLSSGDTLAQLLPVVRGHAEVTQVAHIIDCDADPMRPYEEWRVKEHRKGGQLTWNPEAVKLHLSPNQMGEKCIEGNKLRQELAKKLVLNANVFDYLIHHPHLIPEDWKKDENGNTLLIFFWGTIYRDAGDRLYVCSLYFFEGRWRAGYRWLD